jgi:multidrug efflux pump subunit AcrB
MWIVRLALRRPYTFVVMALAIALLGGAAIYTMPVDIFPYIDIPVVSVIWSYQGISPEEMEKRVVTVFERALTTTVNDVEHIESQSYNGVAVVRIYFQPNAKVEMSLAQVTAISQTLLRILPPGIFAPAVIKYDASSVPILQLGLGSKTLSEQELYDLGQNYIRTQLATVQGAAVPTPFGGKVRQVMVDIDPAALYSYQLSASDISAAISAQNLILPAGSAKLGDREYQVKLNSSPRLLDELNDLPVKTVNGATVYLRDVAQVRDGYSVQSNVVRTNGTRGALLTVLRNGKASTLDIVNKVKAVLPKILVSLPSSLEVKQFFDQSLFVRAAINGVVREAVLAALLTGLMILLFLGSWRSTVIVCISIPLSILTSLIVLSLLGHTVNVMTLGGLALAVGILVDDATVAIENIHRNLAQGKSLVRGVLDGSQQIAVPALVATLSICIVFVPVLLLTGAARYLFTPLAMAVVFAMLASYVLSRTLVPTMAHYLLGSEMDMYTESGHAGEARPKGLFRRLHSAADRGFQRLRTSYSGLLDWALDHRKTVLVAFFAFSLGSLALLPLVGEDFFPTVDSGQIRLHARAPAGTRIEETEVIFAAIEDEIRAVVPADELDTILDNIGMPNSGINLAFSDNPSVGPDDGSILVSLTPERRRPTVEYVQQLRRRLRERFPQVLFYFESANITNQILNFGLPAPVDVQVVGRDVSRNYALAQEISRRIARVPGAADVHIHQTVDFPEVRLAVDRVRAGQMGLTQRDVSNSMLVSLSSSGQVAPNQWLDWRTGVNYQVAVQTPQRRMDSLDALLNTPIAAAGAVSSPAASTASMPSGPSRTSAAYGNPGALPPTTQLLSNLAAAQRGVAPQIVNHYNVQPVFDVYANVDRRDLGGLGTQVRRIVGEMTPQLPRGTTLVVRGQVDTMQTSFARLGLGMIAAVILVYLLMVVNFQSWLDPFIILMPLPSAMAGILWILFATQTTLSVPSLMGAIMCIGVATANSILVVVFANDQRATGMGSREAAHSAGFTRIRPVIMTALAMIMGMLPMAFGLGEGGEQNAPLGRAVIGGLLVATVSTLFVVPVVYSTLRRRPPMDYEARLVAEEQDT